MFSSLPSASKIYVSTSKPRQKSAASSRRRKKRSHTASSSSDIGLTDATLVSLISHDFDPQTFKSSSENCTDFRIEDSLPSRYTLGETLKAVGNVLTKNSDILDEASSGPCIGDFRTEPSAPEVDSFDFNNANLNVTGEAIEVRSVKTDARLDGHLLGNVENNWTVVNFNVGNLSESPSLVYFPDDTSEKNTDIFSFTGLPENVSTGDPNAELPDFDLLNEKGLSENTTEDCSDVKFIPESTIIENINSENISKSISIDCVNSNGLDDNSSEPTLTETRVPIVEIISQCINESLEKDILALPTSSPSKDDEDALNVDHNTFVSVAMKGASSSNLSSGLDQSLIDVPQLNEVPQRTRSPENSELSCTESVSCESKSSVPEHASLDVTVHIADGPSFKRSDICQSHSDLGVLRALDLKRCSSIPECLTSLKETKAIGPSSLDKWTATTNFPCRNCGSVEAMDEKNVGPNQHLCKSKGVSANIEEAAPLNVLPVLTTAHARARSYVFGSTGHTGSLLGNDELSRFFPDSQVTIFVGTWNMNSHSPPKSIDDFLLPLDIHFLPDIYAIGVQEGMQSRFEWEVHLQSTLGPSHVLFASSSLGVLHLSVFVRRDLVWFCSEPEDASVATRPGTLVKTKGAVGVAFTFFGTSFLFVNSHLAAHEQKLKERLLDYEKICSSLDLPRVTSSLKARDKDVTSRFDVVLWCGDLNFRVERDRPSVLSFVEQRVCKSRPSCSFLLKHDQLYKAMVKGDAFNGFQEGVIHFNPSYKFEVGTSTFTSTRLRVPSYTDRILYRFRERSAVTCLHYNSVPDILTSDHKPVFGVFRATLRPGRDNIPLAAGMFKRDIYLEALKRRSQFVGAPQGQSAVCSVM